MKLIAALKTIGKRSDNQLNRDHSNSTGSTKTPISNSLKMLHKLGKIRIQLEKKSNFLKVGLESIQE